MRLVLAVIAGAAVAAFGGLILGEYPFTGATPYVAGVLFALVVAEVILSVIHTHYLHSPRLPPSPTTAVAAALCTLGGLGWAIWISTGHFLDTIPIGAWAALVIGAVVALLRGGITKALRPTGHNPPSS